ncbi:CusA/CzcA family heavy metal efflux RND transporter [Teredinibacter turnerae]|uniref:efflux RND transporter permease subunit n=1 Tax=Teredinibacter turnerae TaxID=2426 RepID=UPI0030CF0C64
MINQIIHWSVLNRGLVLLLALFLTGLGLYAVRHTPVDAIPDLSDVQVIVKTRYPGQSPQVVQDQVTYPLSTALLSVPGAKTVRGFSFFGDSYIYVIFEDKTDLYWARSRVQEYLSQAAPQLPAGATPALGPDATGVGWVYIYALRDPHGNHTLGELRSLQDWFLKYELQTTPGVSEVATVGGMVKQYQVTVDPQKLRAHRIPIAHIANALRQANQEVGASVLELSEAEYMVRATGYLKNIEDIGLIPLGVNERGVPLLLRDVATIGIGPEMRRGLAELNGEGESVGGIIVMRSGENAKATISAVKSRLRSLEKSLPEGVEVVTVYDRSQLIENAIRNLWQKLGEEFLVVAIVCIVFLLHIRSALVAIVTLPLGVLCAFIVMYFQGINANIMSLGGIAIAIGAMIDGAIVMIENMHKHMERTTIDASNRWQIVTKAASEVGAPLFFSLLIITVSFVPVFSLEAQEGRMFSPLAFTKTYAMAAAAILAITLVPVLMGYFVRGRILAESRNPLNRWMVNSYRAILSIALREPILVIALGLLLTLSAIWPLNRIGNEFIPPLDEGDLMYMPTTYPAISIGEARQILQQTDKLISGMPEVATVFGKIGRADTATDPAPLTMIETFIQLKPRSEWRQGMTTEKLKQELDRRVKLPGITNAWVMPIKTRIDMLATGIKTPLGIKITGPDLTVIQSIGERIEQLLQQLPDTTSVYSERTSGARYIDIDINRAEAARFGMSIQEVQQNLGFAVGGQSVTQTVEGQERYPVNLRYPQDYRDTPEKLQALPLVTTSRQQITLADVATIHITDGPGVIKSENARLTGWTFIDTSSKDIAAYVRTAEALLTSELDLPPGYALRWSGQYEYMQRAKQKLQYVLPLTLGLIFTFLFFSFRKIGDVLMIMGSLPLALTGSIWLLYLLDFNFSVATAVGMIALAGVAVEIGVIMLVYLNQAMQQQGEEEKTDVSLRERIIDGAARRVRPVIMTTGATIAGLLPIMHSGGTGSEVMQRLAAPMVGGMVSALLLTLIVIPALFYLIKKQQLPPSGSAI